MASDELKKEFIGRNARICYSKQEFEGEIVDETKNTIIMMVGKEKKMFIKKNSEIILKNQKIQGKLIQRRPEDRIKL